MFRVKYLRVSCTDEIIRFFKAFSTQKENDLFWYQATLYYKPKRITVGNVGCTISDFIKTRFPFNAARHSILF